MRISNFQLGIVLSVLVKTSTFQHGTGVFLLEYLTFSWLQRIKFDPLQQLSAGRRSVLVRISDFEQDTGVL